MVNLCKAVYTLNIAPLQWVFMLQQSWSWYEEGRTVALHKYRNDIMPIQGTWCGRQMCVWTCTSVALEEGLGRRLSQSPVTGPPHSSWPQQWRLQGVPTQQLLTHWGGRAWRRGFEQTFKCKWNSKDRNRHSNKGRKDCSVSRTSARWSLSISLIGLHSDTVAERPQITDTDAFILLSDHHNNRNHIAVTFTRQYPHWTDGGPPPGCRCLTVRL